MSVHSLQKLMIINKTKELGWKIRLKSMAMTFLTWFVWLSMGYMIYAFKDQILDNPVLDMYYIGEVIVMMIAIVIFLMLTTVIWSWLSKRRE